MIAQSPSATPATPLEPLMVELHLAVHLSARKLPKRTWHQVCRSIDASGFKVPGGFFATKVDRSERQASDFWNVFRFPSGTTRD